MLELTITIILMTVALGVALGVATLAVCYAVEVFNRFNGDE